MGRWGTFWRVDFTVDWLHSELPFLLAAIPTSPTPTIISAFAGLFYSYFSYLGGTQIRYQRVRAERGEGVLWVSLVCAYTLPSCSSFQCNSPNPPSSALLCCLSLESGVSLVGFLQRMDLCLLPGWGGLVVWYLYTLSATLIFSPLPHLHPLWYVVPPVLESS